MCRIHMCNKKALSLSKFSYNENLCPLGQWITLSAIQQDNPAYTKKKHVDQLPVKSITAWPFVLDGYMYLWDLSLARPESLHHYAASKFNVSAGHPSHFRTKTGASTTSLEKLAPYRGVYLAYTCMSNLWQGDLWIEVLFNFESKTYCGIQTQS